MCGTGTQPRFRKNDLSPGTQTATRSSYNHTPYGFNRVGDKLVPVLDEMAVVQVIRERREDRWSLSMIAHATVAGRGDSDSCSICRRRR